MEQQTLSEQSHQSRNNFIRETLVNAWPLAEGTHVCARVHSCRTQNVRFRINGGKSSLCNEKLRGEIIVVIRIRAGAHTEFSGLFLLCKHLESINSIWLYWHDVTVHIAKAYINLSLITIL